MNLVLKKLDLKIQSCLMRINSRGALLGTYITLFSKNELSFAMRCFCLFLLTVIILTNRDNV